MAVAMKGVIKTNNQNNLKISLNLLSILISRSCYPIPPSPFFFSSYDQIPVVFSDFTS